MVTSAAYVIFLIRSVQFQKLTRAFDIQVNVLIDPFMRVRISDFGLAVFSDSGKTEEYWSIRGGNLRWLAPEFLDLTQGDGEAKRPTRAADIYSFGCLCIEVSLYQHQDCWDDLNPSLAALYCQGSVRRFS